MGRADRRHCSTASHLMSMRERVATTWQWKCFNPFGDLYRNRIYSPSCNLQQNGYCKWKMYLLNLAIYQLECYDIC